MNRNIPARTMLRFVLIVALTIAATYAAPTQRTTQAEVSFLFIVLYIRCKSIIQKKDNIQRIDTRNYNI